MESLDDGLLTRMLALLPASSLCACAQVDSRLRRLAAEQVLWRGLFAQDYPAYFRNASSTRALAWDLHPGLAGNTQTTAVDWRRVYQQRLTTDACWRSGQLAAPQECLRSHSGPVFGCSFLEAPFPPGLAISGGVSGPEESAELTLWELGRGHYDAIGRLGWQLKALELDRLSGVFDVRQRPNTTQVLLCGFGSTVLLASIRPMEPLQDEEDERSITQRGIAASQRRGSLERGEASETSTAATARSRRGMQARVPLQPDCSQAASEDADASSCSSGSRGSSGSVGGSRPSGSSGGGDGGGGGGGGPAKRRASAREGAVQVVAAWGHDASGGGVISAPPRQGTAAAAAAAAVAAAHSAGGHGEDGALAGSSRSGTGAGVGAGAGAAPPQTMATVHIMDMDLNTWLLQETTNLKYSTEPGGGRRLPRLGTGYSLHAAAVLAGHQGACVTAAAQADLAATASFDGTVKLWRLPEEKPLSSSSDGDSPRVPSLSACATLVEPSPEALSPPICALLLGEDQHALATGGNDRQIKVWDVQQQALTTRMEGHLGWIWSLVDLEGNCNVLASGATDSTVRVWDARAGAEVAAVEVAGLEPDNVYPISGLAARLDGRYLIAGCFDGNTYVVDRRQMQVLHRLPGHTDRITRVSCQGDAILSASFDGNCCLWQF